MKAHYDHLPTRIVFKKATEWLYRPTRKRGKSPKLQTCWEGPYFITLVDVVYLIQGDPRAT
jgi:hypothetical protein